MIINVKVKTSSRSKNVLVKDSVYFVSLKGTPQNNKANIELIDVLSSYFNTSKSSVKILKGLKSKNKIVKILEE